MLDRDQDAVLIDADEQDEQNAENEKDRRKADAELVAVLAASGFAGPRYDRLRDELAKYAVSVLCGWMHTGYVFTLLAKQRFALHPTELELSELHSDPDMRQELAAMTVTVALRRFREHALVGGGWRADGGASLTTYFMGGCLAAFPNEFRKFRSERQRWQSDQAAVAPDGQSMPDPADVVIAALRVREDLARMDPRTRAIVALRMDGYQQDEIAELLGETSVRAVEGVLYRWRTKEAQRLRGEGSG